MAEKVLDENLAQRVYHVNSSCFASITASMDWYAIGVSSMTSASLRHSTPVGLAWSSKVNRVMDNACRARQKRSGRQHGLGLNHQGCVLLAHCEDKAESAARSATPAVARDARSLSQERPHGLPFQE
jgi:hypothetical protein